MLRMLRTPAKLELALLDVEYEDEEVHGNMRERKNTTRQCLAFGHHGRIGL